MVKLGHLDDLQHYIVNYIGNTFGNKVLNNVCTLLSFLDEFYGEDRDVYNSDGGYVVLLEDNDEWEIYNKETDGMLERNNYEDYSQFVNSNTPDKILGDFMRVNFLVNNETMITVFMPLEVFNDRHREDETKE